MKKLGLPTPLTMFKPSPSKKYRVAASVSWQKLETDEGWSPTRKALAPRVMYGKEREKNTRSRAYPGMYHGIWLLVSSLPSNSLQRRLAVSLLLVFSAQHKSQRWFPAFLCCILLSLFCFGKPGYSLLLYLKQKTALTSWRILQTWFQTTRIVPWKILDHFGFVVFVKRLTWQLWTGTGELWKAKYVTKT